MDPAGAQALTSRDSAWVWLFAKNTHAQDERLNKDVSTSFVGGGYYATTGVSLYFLYCCILCKRGTRHNVMKIHRF